MASPYIDSIVKSGGIPIVIPILNKLSIKKVTDKINGLLLSGGFDISPVLYGEEPFGVGKVDPDRDRFEIEITKYAWRLGIPILAICRGIQVLNVALGGTLKQRIKGIKHFQQAERCQPSHSISIEQGSLFHKIIKQKKLMVNSFHHDAIEKIDHRLKATAWAKDEVVEVLEASDPKKFVLGVQFHPECMYEKYPIFRKIFSCFISVCGRHKSTADKKG